MPAAAAHHNHPMTPAEATEIRAVISDFGGVLTMPIAGSFASFAQQSGIPLAALGQAMAAMIERDGVHPLHELECGRMSEETFLRKLEAAICAELGRDDITLADFTECLWQGLAANPPMIDLMASLRAEGYRMALLTNNVREWSARWRALAPIDELFELVVDSAFVGMRKPDLAIYELTAQRLGIPAEECLFIDDFEQNCTAAEQAGMRAVVYRNADQATAEIRSVLGS